MIVVDASALVAILGGEEDAEALASAIENSPSHAGARLVSTVSLWEAACGLANRRGGPLSRPAALAIVEAFCAEAGLEPVPPDLAITRDAVEAAERYGMGAKQGYPGILNLGDCFAYATARRFGAALLFKGNAFARTDIAHAMPP